MWKQESVFVRCFLHHGNLIWKIRAIKRLRKIGLIGFSFKTHSSLQNYWMTGKIKIQLKQLRKESLKKNQAWTGLRTHDPCDIAAVLCQLSYQASWELVIVWVRYIPVEEMRWQWIYENSYIWTAEERMIKWMIIAVIYATLAVAKRKPEKKIKVWTGFEPMTSTIPVQCSTHWAIKPTGSWSLSEFVNIYPLRRWDESPLAETDFSCRKAQLSRIFLPVVSFTKMPADLFAPPNWKRRKGVSFFSAGYVMIFGWHFANEIKTLDFLYDLNPDFGPLHNQGHLNETLGATDSVIHASAGRWRPVRWWMDGFCNRQHLLIVFLKLFSVFKWSRTYCPVCARELQICSVSLKTEQGLDWLGREGL